MPRRPALTPDEREFIDGALAKGKNKNWIAARLGRTANGLSSYLNAHTDPSWKPPVPRSRR